MKFSSVALTLFFLPSCIVGEDGGFGGSGSKNSGSWTGQTDDTAEEEDTEENNGDWPDPLDTNGPSLGEMEARFDDYPNIGTVIEVTITFFDPQDDVDGGWVVLSVNGGDYVDAETEAKIGGQSNQAWIEEGLIWFVIPNVHDYESYDITVMVKDKKDHRSNILEGTVSP